MPTTQASTPVLDSQGNAVAGQSLAGAVTVALTEDQAERASRSSSLWVQGGQLGDPLLDQPFPGRYGFGALRCAIDNLNGDNVEWVGYPTGATHVFCYAYYVQPPPTSGTIIVRKVVDDPAATATQTFTYDGNISYNADNTFTLDARSGQDGEASFYRAAGGVPWTFKERALDGWTLTGLSCTSAVSNSKWTTNVATGQTIVNLGAGDTVTCTYTNKLTPPPSGLTLLKVTLGGVGSFPFQVTGPQDAHQTLTTARRLVPVKGAPLSLRAGRYRVSEELPRPTAAGRWRALGAICNGARQRGGTSISVTLPSGAGVGCLFANRFVPAGAITLRKVTLGGTGTVSFLTSARREPSRTYQQTATTTDAGTPVVAEGDDMGNLPLGTYDITETAAGTTDGRWTLDYVLCNGRLVAGEQGHIRVVLTPRRPKLQCTFVNRKVDEPVPPQPTPTPTPTPTPPGLAVEASRADGPNADLAVTKTVSPRAARPGDTVHYTVTVTNRGPDTANDVVAAELRPPTLEKLNLHTTRGTCRGDRPARCSIGTLAPGQSAVITVTTRATGVGVKINEVAVSSSSSDPNLANNVAAARLTVIRVRPVFTG